MPDGVVRCSCRYAAVLIPTLFDDVNPELKSHVRHIPADAVGVLENEIVRAKARLGPAVGGIGDQLLRGGQLLRASVSGGARDHELQMALNHKGPLVPG